MHLTRRAPPPRWDRRHRRRRTAAGSTMGGRGDGGQVAPAWCGGGQVRAEWCCSALAFILNPSAALAGYIFLGALMSGRFNVVSKGGGRFDVSFTPYQQSWQLAGIFDIEYKQAYHNTQAFFRHNILYARRIYQRSSNRRRTEPGIKLSADVKVLQFCWKHNHTPFSRNLPSLRTEPIV